MTLHDFFNDRITKNAPSDFYQLKAAFNPKPDSAKSSIFVEDGRMIKHSEFELSGIWEVFGGPLDGSDELAVEQEYFENAAFSLLVGTGCDESNLSIKGEAYLHGGRIRFYICILGCSDKDVTWIKDELARMPPRGREYNTPGHNEMIDRGFTHAIRFTIQKVVPANAGELDHVKFDITDVHFDANYGTPEES